MLRFLDKNDNPLPTAGYPLSAVTNTPGKPIPVRFECRDGYYLWAASPAGVTAEARATGDTAWIDIEASPIDVSSYAPDVTDFELRVTPDADGVYDVQFAVSETPGVFQSDTITYVLTDDDGNYLTDDDGNLLTS